ncbi:hypothetical protein H5J25_09190 [Sphingomonas aliaeris]|uniref:Uncharacterized protein n=1 Tax=Sphingomonas aliaeris TaxID=2759526 RepID=A0A974NX95_9SPHN|nr:hypothetical protein [Sphingomonas aliaeris]QQV78734.1 hypothetical protein H5J25_09190 [Sphingomonas aliaeris]
MDGVVICFWLTIIAIVGLIFAKAMVLHMIRGERAGRRRQRRDDLTVIADPARKSARK